MNNIYLLNIRAYNVIAEILDILMNVIFMDCSYGRLLFPRINLRFKVLMVARQTVRIKDDQSTVTTIYCFLRNADSITQVDSCIDWFAVHITLSQMLVSEKFLQLWVFYITLTDTLTDKLFYERRKRHQSTISTTLTQLIEERIRMVMIG
ncbi:Hypothetical_protein [Hexamita inflata]|uniref:Hypothetical_protein n=1 Tax=Hexamita inflata TaxID=28002 RepID=A0ABP1GHJ5_9EUKA